MSIAGTNTFTTDVRLGNMYLFFLCMRKGVTWKSPTLELDALFITHRAEIWCICFCSMNINKYIMWKNGSHANTILDYFFYISNIHFTYEESIIEVSMHISLSGISCCVRMTRHKFSRYLHYLGFWSSITLSFSQWKIQYNKL